MGIFGIFVGQLGFVKRMFAARKGKRGPLIQTAFFNGGGGCNDFKDAGCRKDTVQARIVRMGFTRSNPTMDRILPVAGSMATMPIWRAFAVFRFFIMNC